MIVGAGGLSLNILSIIFISLCTSLILLSATFHFFSASLLRFQAKARLHILWSILLLPWLISLVSLAILVLPEVGLSNDRWFADIVHWHHIYHFDILSWHGASLFVFCIVFSGVCLSKFIKAIKTNSQLNQLDYFIKNDRSIEGLTIIESDTYKAFTSGFFHPRSYITSGLYKKLNSRELTLIAEHELAHAKALDPLKKYLFSLLAAFSPMFIGRQLNEAFSVAQEQIADEKAISIENDETAISLTLLKVSRLNKNSNDTTQPFHCHFSNDPLGLRIRYLLNENKGWPFPGIQLLLFSIAVSLISTLSVDLLHHALEQLFTH